MFDIVFYRVKCVKPLCAKITLFRLYFRLCVFGEFKTPGNAREKNAIARQFARRQRRALFLEADERDPVEAFFAPIVFRYP